jgi:hypothetical protein
MDQGAKPRAGSLLTIMGTIVTAALVLGGVAGGSTDILILSMACAVVTGIIAITGAMMQVTQSENEEQRLPAAPVRWMLPPAARRHHHRMPAPQSAASHPMQGLAGAEAALADLLGQLRSSNADPSWIGHAWHVASTSAAEFRAVARRLESVEYAIAHTPPSQRPTLHDGIMRLRKWLDDGLEAYQGMVAAASKMVIASAPAPVTNELTEAADHLATVAQALTELSDQYAWLQNR